jgi:hypothetical protein
MPHDHHCDVVELVGAADMRKQLCLDALQQRLG